MKKKRIFSAICSALIGVSIAISSTFTCFAKNDEADNKQFVTNILSALTENIEDKQTEDFAYKCDLDFEVSKAMSEGWFPEIKPIGFSGTINQKDGKTSADGKIKYNSKDLINVNGIYDSATKKGYLKIPELNDSYISGTKDDLNKLLENIDADENEITSGFISTDEIEDVDLPAFDFEDVDIEGKVLEYLNIISENIPSLSAGENISGEIDGHKFDYTSKQCSISGHDAKKIANALFEYAKNDDFMKEIAESFGDSDKTVDENLKEMFLSMFENLTEAELNETIDLELFYDHDDLLSGVGLSAGPIYYSRLIWVVDNGDLALELNRGDEGQNENLTGSLIANSGILSGIFNYTNTDEYYSETKKITISDLDLGGEYISGKISVVDTEQYTDEDPFTSNYDFDFYISDNKTDINLKYSFDKDTFLKAHLLLEKAEPVDVIIPTENVYSIASEDGLSQYLSTCDFDGFLSHVKNVIGDELYYFIINSFRDPINGDPSSDDESIPDDILSPISPDKDISENSKDDSSKSSINDVVTKNVSTKKATNSATGNDKSANTGSKAISAGIFATLICTSILVLKKKK